MKKLIIICAIAAISTMQLSCKKEVVGCTDPTATNYNSKADKDNGSCRYPKGQYSFWTDCYVCSTIYIYIDNNEVGKLDNYFTTTPLCEQTGTYTISMTEGTYALSIWESSTGMLNFGDITFESSVCKMKRL